MNKKVDNKKVARLVLQVEENIHRHISSLTELSEEGTAPTGFMASFVTEDKEKINGLEFCKGKTIKELKAYLKQNKVTNDEWQKRDPNDAHDPVFLKRAFHSGIEAYLSQIN